MLVYWRGRFFPPKQYLSSSHSLNPFFLPPQKWKVFNLPAFHVRAARLLEPGAKHVPGPAQGDPHAKAVAWRLVFHGDFRLGLCQEKGVVCWLAFVCCSCQS